MITFEKSEKPCDRCEKHDTFTVGVKIGGKLVATLCAFCLGDAIATPVGWNVRNMLRQWTSISTFWAEERRLGHTRKTAKKAAHALRTKSKG